MQGVGGAMEDAKIKGTTPPLSRLEFSWEERDLHMVKQG